MSLQVIERQETKTWYELHGRLEACELLPNLLPDSKAIKETSGEIETEPEVDDGRYDGFVQDEDVMENEISEFTEDAISEFHDEALAAAKAKLAALKPGETLLHEKFEAEEEPILEEAAKALGIAVPWDPAEAEQIAAAEAKQIADRIVRARQSLANAQAMLDKNAAEIVRAKEQNKPKMLAAEEKARPSRIQDLERARQELESAMAEADAPSAIIAGNSKGTTSE